MRTKFILALALAVAGFAGNADAQTCVGAPDAGECPQTAGATSQIVTNTTWCGAAFPGPIILNEPVFVKGGATLTILPGCVVRGQPRQLAVAAGMSAGTPGALIITQTGKINAVGDPGALNNPADDQPIIFTTAAVDNVNDGVADNVDGNPGFADPSSGAGVFLDDAPLTAPLAPLNSAGGQNSTLWGGVVLLGNAPTNLSDFQGQGHGKASIEGRTFPGFPAADATYGGVNPHDSSGRLSYFSIRHGGDEIGEGNELNCLSLGGIGDGTDISFGECYVNFDDGFEFFGGTVDTDHLIVSYMGDDLFDLDQGYTGIGQFWFGIQGNFNQNSGALYGTASGDKGGEWDGDDYRFSTSTALGVNVNCSTRFQVDGTTSPAPAVENTPWPLSNPAIYNLTLIGAGGSVSDGFANPAVSPLTAGALAGKRGVDMRNGFAGRLFNGLVVNTATGPGLDVRNSDGACPGFEAETNNVGAGLIVVGTSTFEDVAAMGAAETTALTNGDNLRVGLGAVNNANSLNCVNTAFVGLTSENTLIVPTGNAAGKLDATLLPAPINPDPTLGACGANGVPPRHPGLDSGATYRGAFQRGAANWTTGWTSLNRAGLLTN